MAKIKVLLIGTFSEKDAITIAPQNEIEIEKCLDKLGLQALTKIQPSPIFQVILCGSELAGMGLLEMGQTLRMLYPTAQIFYVSEDSSSSDKKNLLKNGFTHSFTLPDEESAFKSILNRALLEAEARLYAPIRLIDVEVGTRLNFEIRIYLPRNNRFVPYIGAGDTFDFNRLARLKTFQVNSLFIPFSDIQKFRDYSAARLLDLAPMENKLSDPEKEKKLLASVKELILGLVHESTTQILNPAKKNVEHIRKIIDQYLGLKYAGDWQQKIRTLALASGDIFEHASNVSTYAVLFAMANSGLPATSGFVGEFMVILAAVKYNFWVGFLAATTLIFGAAYSLWMVKRVFYGDIANSHVAELKDINKRELLILSVLALMVIGFGVYPQPLTEFTHATAAQFLNHMAISKLPVAGL